MSKLDRLIDEHVGVLRHNISSKEQRVVAKKKIKQMFLDMLGRDEIQLWDTEYNMCNKCEFELADDTRDCICVQRNKLRKELREKINEL
jgi:hypothetical protein